MVTIFLVSNPAPDPNALTKSEGDDDSKSKGRRELSAEDCYKILYNISDTDLRLLGLNSELSRPEKMIVKTFPVPPVAIRLPKT